MKLVLLYGAPAAGKLTVGTELAAQTGYKLVDNHKAIDYLQEVFPRSERQYDKYRSRLGRKLRLDMFEAAAEANVDLISTFAPLSPGSYDFIRAACQAVEAAGGTVCLVQLSPNRETLLDRVTHEARRGKKLDDVALWKEVTATNPETFAPFPDRDHLIIDNSHLSATDVAQQIISHYGLAPSAAPVKQV